MGRACREGAQIRVVDNLSTGLLENIANHVAAGTIQTSPGGMHDMVASQERTLKVKVAHVH